jgi:hypothetical protein
VCAQSGGLQILGASPPGDIVGLVGMSEVLSGPHTSERANQRYVHRVVIDVSHAEMAQAVASSGRCRSSLVGSPHLVSCPTWDRDTNDALDW